LFKFKADENFNRRNTLIISKIKIFFQRRNQTKEDVFLRELFNDLEESFIREIIANLEFTIFAEGYYIIRQGESGDCMYFLTSGSADVIIDEKKSGSVKEGDVFGELSLIKEERRKASIKTKTYCSTYKLEKEKFDGLLARFPDFKENIYRKVELIEKKKNIAEKFSNRSGFSNL